YVYWEPWAKGTYLGQGNNKAGVAAHPLPSERKHFSVTEEELGKVLYAVSAPWEELRRDRELLSLLDRPEAEVVRELKKMRRETRKTRKRVSGVCWLSAGLTFWRNNRGRPPSPSGSAARSIRSRSKQ